MFVQAHGAQWRIYQPIFVQTHMIHESFHLPRNQVNCPKCLEMLSLQSVGLYHVRANSLVTFFLVLLLCLLLSDRYLNLKRLKICPSSAFTHVLSKARFWKSLGEETLNIRARFLSSLLWVMDPPKTQGILAVRRPWELETHLLGPCLKAKGLLAHDSALMYDLYYLKWLTNCYRTT